MGKSSWDHSILRQFVGDGAQSVVQEVADVAGGQAGAGADFLVRETFIKLEAEQFAAALVEGFDAEPDQADAFPAGNLLIGQRLRVGLGGGGPG